MVGSALAWKLCNARTAPGALMHIHARLKHFFLLTLREKKSLKAKTSTGSTTESLKVNLSAKHHIHHKNNNFQKTWHTVFLQKKANRYLIE